MREAYKEVMEHVVLTEDMRARILRNIQNIEGLAPKAKLVSFPARCFAACRRNSHSQAPGSHAK